MMRPTLNGARTPPLPWMKSSPVPCMESLWGFLPSATCVRPRQAQAGELSMLSGHLLASPSGQMLAEVYVPRDGWMILPPTRSCRRSASARCRYPRPGPTAAAAFSSVPWSIDSLSGDSVSATRRARRVCSPRRSPSRPLGPFFPGRVRCAPQVATRSASIPGCSKRGLAPFSPSPPWLQVAREGRRGGGGGARTGHLRRRVGACAVPAVAGFHRRSAVRPVKDGLEEAEQPAMASPSARLHRRSAVRIANHYGSL
jgi:hypothetical protein